MSVCGPQRARVTSPGILLVDKPSGITSAKVVQVVKGYVATKKVGHAGTLDPFATGLLVLLCGRKATRLANHLLHAEKEYVLTMRFGSETDTGDLCGRVVERCTDPLPTMEAIEEVLPRFTGEISQVPPLYSAIKKDGRPLYWYARHGRRVEVEARKVRIFSITVVEYLPPDLTLRVTCGGGAYMRALGPDIARALSHRAHLVALRRLRVGPFSLSDAVPLWRIVEEGASVLAMHLLPVALEKTETSLE